MTTSSTTTPTTPTTPQLTPNSRILNFNIGVLGHVDSGKTSLVKALSTFLSTAALDKSSQSRQRGITLDLGFSAFVMPLPPSIVENVDLASKYDLLQVTLVDCPGHASLIRTIIGGAQIIDMVLLVIDATKGIQTQTAECIVIAEMTTRNLIVVLNKIDLFPGDDIERESKLAKVKDKIRLALKNTRFANAPMVSLSACVGGEKVAAIQTDAEEGVSTTTSMNIHGLLELLHAHIQPPNRQHILNSAFHFAIDHCFPIKGQGTVLTGTCLSGSISINDTIEFPTLSIERKIKSMQMFRRKVTTIQQGDRAGICIANFDPKLMERGVCSTPKSVRLIHGAIGIVKKVSYYRGSLKNGSKFHISVGHSTVMATVTFFGANELAAAILDNKSSTSSEMLIHDEDVVEGGVKGNSTTVKNMNKKDHITKSKELKLVTSSLGGDADIAGLPRVNFDFDQDFILQESYLETLQQPQDEHSTSEANNHSTPSTNTTTSQSAPTIKTYPLHWAIIDFQSPVFCPLDSLIIGSRLDTDIQANTCRLAFSGRLVHKFDPQTETSKLKLFSKKEKVGVICRLGETYKRKDDGKIVRYEVYGSDLFKKETNMTQFIGLQIETVGGDVGSITSSFGTGGKFKVWFPAGTTARNGEKLYLRFKRYLHDAEKKIRQDDKLPAARIGTIIAEEAQPKKGKKNNKKSGKVEIVSSDNNKQVTTKEDLSGHEKVIVQLEVNKIFGTISSIKGEILENRRYNMAIIDGFFTPEVNIKDKIGMKVKVVDRDEIGLIIGPFGKAGKCKVSFQEGISAEVGSKAELMLG